MNNNTDMSNQGNQGSRKLIEIIAIWVAAVVSLANLVVIVGKGGALIQTVTTHGERLDRIEDRGSSGLQSHSIAQIEHDKAIEDRLRRLESALLSLPEIQQSVAEIKVSLDWLTGKRGNQMNGNGK